MSREVATQETVNNAKTSLFTRHDLLCEYSKRLRTWADGAMQLALMNRSDFIRDVVAYAATKEKFDSSELFLKFKADSVEDINFRYDWLHYLGRLVALQNLFANDTEFALLCLSASTEHVSLKATKVKNLKLRIELHAERREFQEAFALQKAYSEVLGKQADSYVIDLLNPFTNSDSTDLNHWLTKFNEPFVHAGLAELYLDDSSAVPFNRIRSMSAVGPVLEGPLISVIMTSFAPDPSSLELAARSILDQSWRNLELIVVDDTTPGGLPQILNKLAQEDGRVKIISLEENRGTYYARNVGLKAARGVYATGQDSDDWSHPDRLFYQVQELLKEPNHAGVVGQAIRADENLFRVIRGVAPRRTCEVSLMYSSEVAREMGGYLESRKAADSEFRLRLELFTGRQVKLIESPVYLTRLSAGSLSRGEFTAGWAHPNRRAFLSFMQHWHESSKPADLVLPPIQKDLLGLPPKFRSRPISTRAFDYVFATDWRYDSARVRSALTEIEALRRHGRSVAIMQLGGMFPHKAPLSRLLAEIQQRISHGKLELVIPDEEAEIGTLVVKGPELIQFAPRAGFTNSVARVVVLADIPASAHDGSEPIYDPHECSERASALFGGKPVWATQDPGILRYFTEAFPTFGLLQDLFPYVLPDMSRREEYIRQRIRRSTPLIGAIGQNIASQWPKSSTDAGLLWPSSGEKAELQLLGSSAWYPRRYSEEVSPERWTQLPANRANEFYATVDYFVYYPDANWPQEISYEAFVAYAYGATVVLPERFRANHDDLAIMMAPADVADFIQVDWATGRALSLGNSKQPFEININHDAFVEMLDSQALGHFGTCS